MYRELTPKAKATAAVGAAAHETRPLLYFCQVSIISTFFRFRLARSRQHFPFAKCILSFLCCNNVSPFTFTPSHACRSIFFKGKGIRFSRCMSCSMCKYIPVCHSTAPGGGRCCDSPVVSCNARAPTHTHVRMYIHVYAYVQYCIAHRSHSLRKKRQNARHQEDEVQASSSLAYVSFARKTVQPTRSPLPCGPRITA